MKVHRELGPGFLEAVYEEALEKEFIKGNIPYRRQTLIQIYYEGEPLKKEYRADFICYEAIILELKAVTLIPTIFYQTLNNYLKGTKTELGILVNFGTPSLTYKRILNQNP
jgi:GxxExxY protein